MLIMLRAPPKPHLSRWRGLWWCAALLDDGRAVQYAGWTAALAHYGTMRVVAAYRAEPTPPTPAPPLTNNEIQ